MRHLTQIALVVGLTAVAGCGTGSLILWNPRGGLCHGRDLRAGRGALRRDAGRRRMALRGGDVVGVQ